MGPHAEKLSMVHLNRVGQQCLGMLSLCKVKTCSMTGNMAFMNDNILAYLNIHLGCELKKPGHKVNDYISILIFL